MAFAYRYLLDGQGPYESEKFDTEEALEAAAADRRHKVEETISFDADGNPASDKRESIVISDDAPSTQEKTGGTQPA